ncbi:acyl-CoA thioester hydrolase/BAAT C-terminal domain-containing protein [uncultured Maricaulis sp.]|uniref:acyl-CoA thioester hydrolase/BAAT C-terminal domain-containing protein n=1 Tax=uncultured Maricaulis sp. TaxID=174710 RepID=UPI0030D88731
MPPMSHADVVVQLVEIDPDGERIPPLVILLGGSNGGLWFGDFLHDLTARRISSLGLSYFGHDGQPDQLVERPLEPIAAVIELARETRGAQHRCLAVIGVSKGGELALLLAAHEQEFVDPGDRLMDATIAASPSHVAWQAPHIRLGARSSWSLAGRPLDFVPYPWLSTHLPDVFFNRYEVGEYHLDALQNERAVEAAAIPVERVTHPTLLIAGQNDAMWPAVRMAQAALDRARRLNPDTPVQLEIRDLDHFVLSDAATRQLAIDFLIEALRDAAAAGDCQADFE